MEIKIVRFKDGLDVICDCTSISSPTNDQYKIVDPMLFEIRGVNLMLQYWLPVAVMKDDFVYVNKEDILCTMDPNDDFAEYYVESLRRMKEENLKDKEVALTDEVLLAFEEKDLTKSLLH